MQNTYLTLVRACKSTTAYSLPSINLMKNSASELYTIDHSSAYQHAFGYIRQLAILLRNSLKVKSKVSHLENSLLVSTGLTRIPGSIQTGVQLAVCSLYRLLGYCPRSSLRPRVRDGTRKPE